MLNRNPMLNKALLPAFWQYSVVRSFFSRLWNCRIWKFHKWTCNHEQGIKPTKEQLENGIEGFYDYAKMYGSREVDYIANRKQYLVCVGFLKTFYKPML